MISMLWHLALQVVPYMPPNITDIMTELLVKGVFADGATSLLQKLWVERFLFIYFLSKKAFD